VGELQIFLQTGEGSDDEELAAHTSKLRRRLLELDVDDVRHATTGPPPEGARAAGMVEVGTLLVALAGTPHLLASVGQVLSSWMSSRHGRGVAVQIGGDRIELSGITRDDQERLLMMFEQRAGG
jgi:Effector Associated Constant Component 1